MNINKYLLYLALFIFFLLPAHAFATNASLYLSPSSGTFFVGSTFDVSIFVDTDKANVNTIKADIKFDPRQLQIVNPSAGKSLISEWLTLPVYSNSEGTISLQGGIIPPGINTNSGLVSTLTFRAMTAGQTTVIIENSSMVLLADGTGKNVLKNTGQAVYEIVIPPQAGPEIHSISHPNPNQWYRDTNAVFGWSKEEGVDAFSYLIDQSPDNIPDNTPEGEIPSVVFNDLTSGIWYFHLKAKKGNIWSGASHYLIKIDTIPPTQLELSLEGEVKSFSVPIVFGRPMLHFSARDSLSGIDHYAAKIINLSENQKEQDSFFLEVTSPFRLPQLKNGEYEIIIRAHDRAGNWLEKAQKIEVIDKLDLFFFSKKGLWVGKIFINWWQISLILILLTALIIFIIFKWRSRHRNLAARQEKLEKLKFKIRQQEEEIKKQLSKESGVN